MPRDMIENERSTAINPSEAVEEKVSLSDRFGLWLGFHPCDQDEYLAMIRGYCDAYGVEIDDATLRAEAIELASHTRCSFWAGGVAVFHRPRRSSRRFDLNICCQIECADAHAGSLVVSLRLPPRGRVSR